MYNYPAPLLEGRILSRYKRFFADVELPSGEKVVAHVPNTGSMKGCWAPGWRVLLSHHDDPKRKLKYTLEMTHNGTTWIVVNTGVPNKLVINAIQSGLVPELSGYAEIIPEHTVGKSRIDILLRDPAKGLCYVEIKNVTLKDEAGPTALFPDAVSERGQKHLEELTILRGQGHRAVMFYLCQREDVEAFRAADHIDPDYADLLSKARQAGVEVLAYQSAYADQKIGLKHPIKSL